MATTAACIVMGGCQANVVTLELIINKEKDIGYILTFFQFVFVASCALWWTFDFRRFRFRPFQLPRKSMLLMSLVFWVVSALNNAIFMFDISVPVQTTFRSSSLIVNMILGRLIFKKRYSVAQILCASAITVGILLMTLEAKRRSDEEKFINKYNNTTSDVLLGGEGINDVVGGEREFAREWWLHPMMGIALLSVSTLLAAVLGSLQEVILSRVKDSKAKQQQQQILNSEPKKDPKSSSKKQDIKKEERESMTTASAVPEWAEMMFICHAVAAPMFFSFPQRMRHEWNLIVSHPEAPELVSLIGFNCATQLVCIIGVYRMVNCSSSFTVTLTLTMRKFFSILFSIVYFQHFLRLAMLDWVGILLVAAGSTLYSLAPKPAVPSANVEAAGNKKKTQ